MSLLDLRRLISADTVGYLVAATLGALLVLFVQWLTVARKKRRRRLAWEPRSSDRFRCYVGLIVPDERGTTEVDEVLVTPAGIFVIEKKDFSAWIFGSETDEHWVVSILGRFLEHARIYHFANGGADAEEYYIGSATGGRGICGGGSRC